MTDRNNDIQELLSITKLLKYEGNYPGWFTFPIWKTSKSLIATQLSVLEINAELLPIYIEENSNNNETYLADFEKKTIGFKEKTKSLIMLTILRVARKIFKLIYKYTDKSVSEMRMKKIFWFLMRKIDNKKIKNLISRIASERL